MTILRTKVSHVEIEPKYLHFRVYGDHPDHYIASAHIHLRNGRGLIEETIGEHALDQLARNYEYLVKKYDLYCLEGDVLPEVQKACNIIAKRNNRTIKETGSRIKEGRTLISIVIT